MSYLLPQDRPSPWLESSETRHAPWKIQPLPLESLLVATMDGQLIPFKPLPAQLEVFRKIRQIQSEMATGKRIRGKTSLVVLKARRMGISTAIQALAFKMAATKPRSNALVIAHEIEPARYLYSISERFYRELPEDRRPPRRFHTRRGISFEDPLDSSLTVSAIGEGAGRSFNINLFHGSEVAFWGNNAASTLAGVRQAIPSFPWCLSILESTGFGLGGTFYDEFRRAKTRNEALFFPWWRDPRYRLRPGLASSDWNVFEKKEAEKYRLDGEQVAWMRVKFETDCACDEKVWRQEYPGCEADAFQGKATAVFSPELVEVLYDHVAEVERGTIRLVRGLLGSPTSGTQSELLGTVERVDDPGGPTSAYVIGADPALGTETGDYSAAVVLDRCSGQVVAILNAHLDPDQFASALIAMGRYYNSAWLVVERNAMGHAVISRIKDSRYPRLWSERRPWQKSAEIAPKYGWATTEGSKRRAIETLVTRLRKGQLHCCFSALVDQLVKYQYEPTNTGSRATAPSGEHDDLCMGLVLASVGAEELGVTDPVERERIRLQNIPVDFTVPVRYTMKDFREMEALQHPERYAIGDPVGVVFEEE